MLRVRAAAVRDREHIDLARDHIDQRKARARRRQAEIDHANAVALRNIASLHRELFSGDSQIVHRRWQRRHRLLNPIGQLRARRGSGHRPHPCHRGQQRPAIDQFIH
jgi:hypothetical protein